MMTGFARKAIRLLPSGVKLRLRSAVHPAKGHALKRAFGPKTPDFGELTVVIPAFNVEAYLAQCLDSVISQSYTNLEIVIVDDGSTDSTLKIANSYARSDKRIRIIGLEHGGNGQARNIGIAAARGSHLTFADSDDVVAEDAYLTMMQTINRTGSDFVVGSSDRLIGSKRVSTKLSTRLHAVPRLAVSLAEYPEILDDVFLWNKLFQRKFWDQYVGLIPEGIFYEDQETTARAFMQARSFDVLVENVYSWRQRPDGKSITQAKGELKNLQDRLKVAKRVSQLLLTDANSSAVQVWCKRLFGSDLVPYFDLVANKGDDYWETLQSGVSGLLHTFAAAESIHDSTWDSMDPHARVFLKLVEANTREGVEDVVVDRIDSGNGFEVVLERGRFVARPNYWEDLEGTEGALTLSCTTGSLEFESEIRLRDLQDGRGPVLRGHAYIRGFASSAERDSIHVSIGLANGLERPVQVKRIDDTRIDVSANDAFASHAHSGFELDLKSHPEFINATSVRVELSVGDSSWNAVHSLKIAETMDASQRNVTGNDAAVVGFAVDKTTESFSIDVDWGRTSASEQVFLSTSQTRIDPSGVQRVGGSRSRYTFELHHLHWGRQVYSYPSGAYSLRHMPTKNSKAIPFRATAKLSMETPLDHPLEHSNLTAWLTQSQNFAVSIGAPLSMVERSKYGQRQLQLSFSGDQQLTLSDHVLIESFGGTQCTDSPMSVARELHLQRPTYPVYVSLVDFSVPYSSYMYPAVRGSAEWYDRVGTAKILVNNNNFPHYFNKRSRQVYLQTWHGTPLKTIGNHTPIKYMSPSYRRRLQKESPSWDIMVASNDHTRRIFESAFDIRGIMPAYGYPRNDELVKREEFPMNARREIGIKKDGPVVLFAPTWRDNNRDENSSRTFADADRIQELLKRIQPDATLLIRAHHNAAASSVINSDVIDVTDYPDVNVLIEISDVLVTDYSSILFDYALLQKPILVYAPDLEEYRDSIRGLYLSLDELPISSYSSTWSGFNKNLRDVLTEVGRVDVGGKPFKSELNNTVFHEFHDGMASRKYVELLMAKLEE